MFPYEKEEFIANTGERRAKYRQYWHKATSTEEGKEWNREKARKQREKDPDHLRKWRKDNPEKVKSHLKKQQNSDEYKEYMREYMREYRKKQKKQKEKKAEKGEAT